MDSTLLMEAMAANTLRIPSMTSLVLTFGILLPVAASPAGLRVVVMRREHPQSQSNKQSDEPQNRDNATPTLVSHSYATNAKRTLMMKLKKRGEK